MLVRTVATVLFVLWVSGGGCRAQYTMYRAVETGAENTKFREGDYMVLVPSNQAAFAQVASPDCFKHRAYMWPAGTSSLHFVSSGLVPNQLAAMDVSKKTTVGRRVGVVYHDAFGGIALESRSPVRRLPLFVTAVADKDVVTMPDTVRDEITKYYTVYSWLKETGHGLANTLQSIEKRWHRLRVEWVMPGTPYEITEYDGAETVETPFREYECLAVDPYDSMIATSEKLCSVVYDEHACEWIGSEYVGESAGTSRMAKRYTGRFVAADGGWVWKAVEEEDSLAKRTCK
jgi:hypothetical protein